jgi:hypothetical protein
VLRQLHESFAVEVGAWGEAMVSLQQQIQGRAFPTLWGLGALFLGNKKASIVRLGADGDEHLGLRLALDPHLTVLAAGLALPGPPNQMSLFPAIVVRR